MSYRINEQKTQSSKKLAQQILFSKIQTQQGLQNLIKFVTNLSPTIESSKVIKKLLIRYGLAIMIYLKPCYDKLNIQQEEEIQKFKQLAGIAKQMIFNRQIKEIEFLFKFGVITYKKQVKKYANQKYFINIVEQISKLNQRFISLTLGNDQNFQHYNQKFNQLKQNYFLMIQNQADINEETQLLIKKSFNQFRLPQNNFYLKQTKYEKTSIWGDSADESEQQIFGDYYDHHNSVKTFSQCLSYSMLSSQANSFLAQKNRSLCCRKFFFKDQWLNYEQNLRTTFLQIKYPFNDIALQEIKKAICSMLNCQGGKIYIGISKQNTEKKQIKAIQYTQNDKQQIYKQFRRSAQKIEPQILTKKLYSAQFIPICDQNKQFIPGANIIRISVDYGIRDQIYSYEKDGLDYFPFRNDIEIIQKQGRQLLKAHRSIILKPLSIPAPLHTHPCEKPQIGEPLHQRYSSGITIKKQKRYDAKPNLSQMNLTSTTLQKQEINAKHIYSMQVQRSKKSVTIKRGPNDPNQTQHVKKQHSNYAYFYVIGLDQKHLTPIFIEKGIIKNIKIQSTKDHKLVVRIDGNSQIQKAGKILKKIGQKYEKKNIKVYEMSVNLEIQKKNYDQGIKLINNLKLAYRMYSDNRVKFKLFRESLQAFIELQSNKIPVKFFIQNQQINKIIN